MIRILLMLALLASNPSLAYDGDYGWLIRSKQQLISLLILGGLTVSALADTNTTSTSFQDTSSSSDGPATTYFVYWSTWLGVTFGIIDVLGWAADWVINGYFYIKGDTRSVKKLKKRIQKRKQRKQYDQREKVLTVAKICKTISEHIENEGGTPRANQLVLECITFARGILQQEIAAEEGAEGVEKSADDAEGEETVNPS